MKVWTNDEGSAIAICTGTMVTGGQQVRSRSSTLHVQNPRFPAVVGEVSRRD